MLGCWLTLWFSHLLSGVSSLGLRALVHQTNLERDSFSANFGDPEGKRKIVGKPEALELVFNRALPLVRLFERNALFRRLQ